MLALFTFCGLREWRRRRLGGAAAPVDSEDNTFSRASSLSTFSELAEHELATKDDAEAAAHAAREAVADASELMRKLLPAQSTDRGCLEKPAKSPTSSEASSRETSPHGRRTN